MAVTDVIIDKGATATDKGGMVFNVKAYGALGTALSSSTQDDTAAFQAAITAASLSMGTLSQTASSGLGSVVFVPHGIYRIKGTLSLPNGVSIRGAGMHTTQLLFSMATTQDGLVWQRPTPTSPFGV
ncbi:glycosyl hydrolase family 28-related protein, partial [Longimicrobium sp.]|uniref:glycosyl hydrolase family 28-related protein n=1 Tax=Longimicrobium sp. TaxID=2029185 RepID=UPI002E30BEDA